MAARLRIGDWLVDAGANRLRHVDDGRERSLRHKAMALLLLLAEQPGETVSRELIEQRIWDGNGFVAPKAINTAIWAIRQALGDDPEQPRYLETIAKKGYRLIASVERLPDTPPAPAAARRRWHWGLLALPLAAAAIWFVARQWLQTPAAPPATAPQAITQYPGVEFAGAISPDGRLLAFAWWQGQGDADLYLRPLADRQATPRAVGGAKGDVTGLAWSADGQSLASIARAPDGRCQLWRIDLREHSQTALADCEPLFTPSLAWSDDGQWLAYTGNDGAEPGLFLIHPDGSGKRRLTRSANRQLADHQPAFSPDGRRLAFVRAEADGSRDVYEIQLPDGAPRRLTQLRLPSLHGLSYHAGGQDLLLSSTRQDSRQLLRWRRSDGALQPLGLEGSAPLRGPGGDLVYSLLRSHVSLARLDLRQAQPQTQRQAAALASRRLPALNEDGRNIAFIVRDAGHSQLWVQQGDALPRELLQLAGEISRPSWSSDGRQLAFIGACGPARQLSLCRVDADGRDLRALLPADAGTGAPSWVGEQLALVRTVAGDSRGQVWRVDPHTGKAQAWTGAPPTRAGARLAWQAQSGQLYVPSAEGDALVAWDGTTRSAERWDLPSGAGAERLVTWVAHPEGLLLLLRGGHESLQLLPSGGGAPRELGRYPLGSFPERAAMSLSGDARWLAIELSDAAHGDLMWLRGGAASP